LDLVIRAAVDGARLAFMAEDRVTDYQANGTLARVLEDWCPPFLDFSCTIRVAGNNRPP
jgi:hypothetical protein